MSLGAARGDNECWWEVQSTNLHHPGDYDGSHVGREVGLVGGEVVFNDHRARLVGKQVVEDAPVREDDRVMFAAAYAQALGAQQRILHLLARALHD